jgi:hypothetical protein
MWTSWNPLYPSQQEIKEAICRHGSVISAVKSTAGFKSWGRDPAKLSTTSTGKRPSCPRTMW